MTNENDQFKKLHEILLETIKREQELREQYQVGEKFRFIRDRLNALKTQFEANLLSLQEKKEDRRDQVLEDETVVYVYLFNAQGANIKSWQNMLNPAVFYEYSVNRPIYADKTLIDAFLRSKTNKHQNGYLAVIVKKIDILKTADTLKDSMSNPLVKVKEGSLKFEKFIFFSYNNCEFVLNASGELEKKHLPTTP